MAGYPLKLSGPCIRITHIDILQYKFMIDEELIPARGGVVGCAFGRPGAVKNGRVGVRTLPIQHSVFGGNGPG